MGADAPMPPFAIPAAAAAGALPRQLQFGFISYLVIHPSCRTESQNLGTHPGKRECFSWFGCKPERFMSVSPEHDIK